MSCCFICKYAGLLRNLSWRNRDGKISVSLADNADGGNLIADNADNAYFIQHRLLPPKP